MCSAPPKPQGSLTATGKPPSHPALSSQWGEITLRELKWKATCIQISGKGSPGVEEWLPSSPFALLSALRAVKVHERFTSPAELQAWLEM